MFFEKIEKQLRVLIPDIIKEQHYTGDLYGYHKAETGIFNITSIEKGVEQRHLGRIVEELPNNHKNVNKLYGIWQNDELIFFYRGKQYTTEYYSLYLNIFSRNTGILETAIMKEKSAVILGCGSVGSLVALELARSGVGKFLLVDTDVLEYHNICRHQCGIHEVGDYKVDILKRRILDINPSAEVIVRKKIVEHLSQNDFEVICDMQNTIFVGCADNRKADVYSNMVAARFGCSFISIGFWERALAGEIFYWLPNKNMPCYGCALGGGGVSGRVEANNHHVYSNQVDIEKLKFEPGISIDINFITCIGIKLALDILNQTNESYIPRLLNHLQQYTLICNTSNPQIGGEMVEIFSYPLQITTSLKVNFGISCKDKICRYEK